MTGKLQKFKEIINKTIQRQLHMIMIKKYQKNNISGRRQQIVDELRIMWYNGISKNSSSNWWFNNKIADKTTKNLHRIIQMNMIKNYLRYISQVERQKIIDNLRLIK